VLTIIVIPVVVADVLKRTYISNWHVVPAGTVCDIASTLKNVVLDVVADATLSV